MTWVKLDDHFDEHTKIAAVSNDALALFVVGLAYSNRNLTDGFIPNQVGLGQLRWCDGNTVPAIRELEEAGLWERCERGWNVHDFHDYQPTKEAVLAEREAARMRKSRERSRKKSRPESQRDTTVNPIGVTPVPVPVPVPVLPSIEEGIAVDVDSIGEFVAELKDSDEKTEGILKAMRCELPEGAFRSALESLQRRRSEDPPLVSETRYFVATLASMKREGQYA